MRILLIVPLAALWAAPNMALADDWISESEVSEILEDVDQATAPAADDPGDLRSARRADQDDEADVDSEIGQTGAQDALYESAGYERPTPIPLAKPEPWMKKPPKTVAKKKAKKTKVASKPKPFNKVKKKLASRKPAARKKAVR